MSCFGMARSSSTGWPLSSPARSTLRRVNSKPWRLWRRCAGLAATIGSKIRRRAVRWHRQGDSRRRRRSSTASSSASSMREGWCHHRSFAPVYVDELYSHPKTHHVAIHDPSPPPPQQQQQQTPSTTVNKLAARRDAANIAVAAAATNAGAKNAAVAAAIKAGESGKAPRVRGGKKAVASNGGGGKGGVRRLVMSPMRGGGVCGMGKVDVRAEMFIRKFREEMRLQTQKSAEEFHAMLARGL